MLRCAVFVFVSMCSRLVPVVVGADSVMQMPRGATGADHCWCQCVSVVGVRDVEQRK